VHSPKKSFTVVGSSGRSSVKTVVERHRLLFVVTRTVDEF